MYILISLLLDVENIHCANKVKASMMSYATGSYFYIIPDKECTLHIQVVKNNYSFEFENTTFIFLIKHVLKGVLYNVTLNKFLISSA